MTDVNIIDIAAYAGVSVSTVSRVLNRHPDVSEATREKVMRVIDQYGYIPNDSARSLKRTSMRAVGVIVKGFSNPFFTNMLTIIQKELDDNGYECLIRQVDPNESELDSALALVKEKRIRGLVFLGGNFAQQADKLSLLEIPFVMATIGVKTEATTRRLSTVSVDDYAEAYAVTEHIIDSGHKRIAAIGYRADDWSISKLRITGFIQAMKDHGLPIIEEDVEYAGEFSLPAGYEAGAKLLKRGRYTCIFCISDLLALGAMRAIYDGGLKVPADISVVGFDGIELGRYAIPSLATVKQPDEEMAYQTVRILMDCLRNKRAEGRQMVFKARFQQGESFAARK